MAHPLFGPEVRLMLAENSSRGLKTFSETLHPTTVAETLSEDAFTVEEAWHVLEQTSVRNQAAIFEYFPIQWQVKMAEGGGRAKMAKLIEQMSHDDRVDLLRRLDPRVADGLLRLVDEADRKDIAELFRYSENTVGGIMTTDYAWLPETLTAGQAIDRLRQQAPDKETIYYIYILEETSRRLLGLVTLRDLVLKDRFTPLRELMNTDVIALKVGEEAKHAADVFAKYDFIAVPVVDDDKRLVGIVTHDDVIDVIRAEATEDLQKQGAVGSITEGYFEAKFFSVWRSRTMWLSMLFVAEMMTYNALTAFEETLEKVLVLKYFIALCIATGGNSGTQAATLVTRAIALGDVRLKDWLRILRREFLMGFAMGLAIGALGFVRAYFVEDHRMVYSEEAGGGPIDRVLFMLMIANGVGALCIFGSVVGSMVPLVFKRFGIDPAYASGPGVATLVDVTGILIFFSIAKLYLL
jgi:magnesium transporter